MIKALIYKEWLKIRWILLASMAVFLIEFLHIAMTTGYNMRNAGAEQVFYYFTIRQMIFYGGILVYIPGLAGIVLAFGQYLPEISASRLKLTLHLPLKENKILIYMNLIGTISLLIIFMLMYFVFSMIVLYFFPAEILISAIKTSLPWFLVGLFAYWATTVVLIEAVWIRRILYIPFVLFFMNLIVDTQTINVFQNIIVWLFLVAIIFATFILYSGWRYRKGVR